jgi:hypothetical protein
LGGVVTKHEGDDVNQEIHAADEGNRSKDLIERHKQGEEIEPEDEVRVGYVQGGHHDHEWESRDHFQEAKESIDLREE